MYLLSFFIVLLVSFYTIAVPIGVTGNWDYVFYYFDLGSFVLLILLCVPILIGSGLFWDFNNAFRLAIRTKEKVEERNEKEDKNEKQKVKKRKEVSLLEIKHAIEAVSLVRKVLITGGIFLVLLTLVEVFSYLIPGSEEGFGPNLSITILPLLYAFAIDLFLLPIEARLKVRQNNMIHQ